MRKSLSRAAAGARVIIVNVQPTPYDDVADAVVRQPIGRVVPILVAALAEAAEAAG